MSVQQLPAEIWLNIADSVAQSGTTALVGLTKVSQYFHEIAKTMLYQADVLESGGVKSINHGLEQRLINVIENSLAAGTSPNVRIYSRKPLDSLYPRNPPTLPRLEGSCRAIMHCTRPDPRFEYHQGTEEPTSSEFAAQGAEDMREDVDFLFEKSCYWTPLHVAATRNDVELLELLLERGADPNSAGRGVCFCHTLPPQRTISIYDDQDLCEEVLERTLLQRWSPLHVAVCKGQLDCAQVLIDRFGLAHATESDEVVMEEARQVIREEPTALESAFDIEPLDQENYFGILVPRFDPLSPMHIAASKYESVKDLERLYDMLQRAGCLEGRHPHSGVDVLDAFGDTPLAVAAFSGRIHVLGGWLRSHGADINFVLPGFHVGNGDLPLFFALCQEGLYRDALFLMDMGVDTNANMERNLGIHRMTPLHFCCNSPLQGCNRTEAIVILRRLIDDGADIDFKDTEGCTPLISAVDGKFTDAVKVLLRAQANVGLVDHNGASALHHAVANVIRERNPCQEALRIVELLLDYGSDPNQCSGNTGPPLFACQYRFGRDRSELIGDSRSPGSEPNGMVSIAPLLVSRGANPNQYFERPGDIRRGSLQDQLDDLRLRGGSLAISAFREGEFESLDSLVACGTIVTYHDYLFMMRSLVDERPGVRPLAPTSRAVEALFRLLNSPGLRLGQSGDKEKIMDAWTQMLLRAEEFRSWIIPALTPHLAMIDMNRECEIDVLHVIFSWEPNMGETADQFEDRIREALADLLRGRRSEVIEDNSRRSPRQNAIDRANVPIAKALIWRPFSRPATERMA